MSGFKPTRQANDISPPIESKVTALATTGSSVAYVTPTTWADNYVTAMADGDAVHITFGDALVVVDKTAVAGTVGSPAAITNDDTSSIKIPDGSFISFRVLSGDTTTTHFAVQGAAGGGFVRFWLSSN